MQSSSVWCFSVDINTIFQENSVEEESGEIQQISEVGSMSWIVLLLFQVNDLINQLLKDVQVTALH